MRSGAGFDSPDDIHVKPIYFGEPVGEFMDRLIDGDPDGLANDQEHERMCIMLTDDQVEHLRHIDGALDLLITMAKDNIVKTSGDVAESVSRYRSGKDTTDHDIYYNTGKFDAWNAIKKVLDEGTEEYRRQKNKIRYGDDTPMNAAQG